MARHSLDLTLDPVGDAVVRGCWERLHAAGLASPHGHASTSNRPHVTLAAAAEMSADLAAQAGAAVEPLLPVPVELGEPATFAGRALVLHLPVVVPDGLRTVVDGVRRAAQDPRVDEPWAPHVTLVARLALEDLPRALAVVEEEPPGAVVLAGLTWWDPQARTVTRLVGPDAGRVEHHP